MSSHRLTEVVGMRIRYADGRGGDRVLDLRFAPSQRVIGPLAELAVEGIIAGKMRPGTLFGYDRNREQGPWLVRAALRVLHRHTGYVTWNDVDHIAWDDRTIHLRVNELADLTAVSG